jgi:hypothetical protein
MRNLAWSPPPLFLSVNFDVSHDVGQQGIPLSVFPARTASKLQALSKHGLISLNDLEDAADALQQSRANNRMLLQGFVAMLVFLVVITAALGGITWYIVQASKEMTISHEVLTSTATNAPVRVASADMSVIDNTLVAAGAKCAFPGSCTALRVSVEESSMPLSSQLPDDALKRLKSLSLEAPDSYLHLSVNAFTRYSGPDPKAQTFGPLILMPYSNV